MYGDMGEGMQFETMSSRLKKSLEGPSLKVFEEAWSRAVPSKAPVVFDKFELCASCAWEDQVRRWVWVRMEERIWERTKVILAILASIEETPSKRRY